MLPTPPTIPALAATPMLMSTAADAATAALPTTPALAATPALPTTAALPATPALPTTAALPATPALPLTPGLSSTPTFSSITGRSVPRGNSSAASDVSPDMFESISKQLRARRLINQRAPYRRSDEVYIAPRQRWY